MPKAGHKIVYVERWVPELCLRGYLDGYEVPEEVDPSTPEFLERWERGEFKEVSMEFLGATDAELPDPQNHEAEADVTVHVDREAALRDAQRGAFGEV